MDIFAHNDSELDFENASISVSQLNKLAKTLLENNMPIFWVKGEISGFKLYSHGYFDLKDENSKVSCVIFARILKSIDFELANGQQVEVRGRITIYPANGSYQINVERIRQLGVGDLWEAYNRLLNKLKLEGLFLDKYKKRLPIFPLRVGVITSKEGAVIKDVIATLTRRAPYISIIVYHTLVQGNDASMSIANAIKTANKRSETDVLIVCRGGGSMEDLWCFNSEVVAREVFNSKIPIISAVGHETDTTIIDYVADLRAPTPTAAAELVAKSADDWNNQIINLYNKLEHNFNNYVITRQQLLDNYFSKINLINPLIRVDSLKQQILNLELRLKNRLSQIVLFKRNKLDKISSKIKFDKTSLNNYYFRLEYLTNELYNRLQSKLQHLTLQIMNLEVKLRLLNPHSVLDRGYVILKNKSGRAIINSQQVKHNERLEVVFKDGSLSVIVDKNYNYNQDELI